MNAWLVERALTSCGRAWKGMEGSWKAHGTHILWKSVRNSSSLAGGVLKASTWARGDEKGREGRDSLIRLDDDKARRA